MMMTIKDVIDALQKVKDQNLFFIRKRDFISLLLDVTNQVTLERDLYIQFANNKENNEDNEDSDN